MKNATDLLGLNLKRLREDRKWTQADLAEAAELSVQMIQKLEYGRTNPSTDTLDKLAKAFGEPVVELFAVGKGGRIPLEHVTPGAVAGLKQLQKGARKRMDAELAGVKLGKHIATGAKVPPNVDGAFELLSRFRGLKGDRLKLVSMLVFDDPAYLADNPALARAAAALLEVPEPKK